MADIELYQSMKQDLGHPCGIQEKNHAVSGGMAQKVSGGQMEYLQPLAFICWKDCSLPPAEKMQSNCGPKVRISGYDLKKGSNHA